MKFGSCMCFSSSSFTVGLLFRIARNYGKILGFSPDQCYGICCCAFSSMFIKFITELQKDFLRIYWRVENKTTMNIVIILTIPHCSLEKSLL